MFQMIDSKEILTKNNARKKYSKYNVTPCAKLTILCVSIKKHKPPLSSTYAFLNIC